MLRAEATPLDPGLSAGELLPGAPWADAVLPLLDVERRNGKVYLPGSAAGLGEREEEAAALEAKVLEAGLTPVPVDDAELARFLEESGRLVRVGDGLAIGPDAYRRGKTRRDRGVRASRERSRWPASATSWVSLASRRSSCSSGSTPTASRGASGDERVLRRKATIDR